MDNVFPYGFYAFPSWRAYLDSPERPLLEPGEELPVRLTPVPKTAKAPRLIAIEPTSMQYMQQGLLSAIEEEFGSDDLLTHFLGWHDQTPNQRLAREGSITGTLATLDLKEASDRVSAQLVWTMMRGWQPLREAVDACRSRKVDVPGHGVIRLAKFASMGSALTFPIESMVFLAIIFSSIGQQLNTSVTRKFIQSFRNRVRVYGDDIIVPVEFVRGVYTELETFGFRVNGGKSFWTGKFRESCGKEFYAGYDVSIVKLRRRLPTTRRHAREIISAVSLRNQLKANSYNKAADLLDQWISLLIPFPKVLEDSPVLGRIDGDGLYDVHRQSDTLHCPLVKGVVVSAKLPISRLDGWPALHKYFLRNEGRKSFNSFDDLLVVDREHLLRAGRPVSVDIKTRWTIPY